MRESKSLRLFSCIGSDDPPHPERYRHYIRNADLRCDRSSDLAHEKTMSSKTQSSNGERPWPNRNLIRYYSGF